MKKFLQICGLMAFLIFVIFLGVFAYRMSSSHLVFAFHWQQNQEWKQLTVAFSRPWTLSRFIPSWPLLDADAIKKSILYNGNILSEDDFENFDIQITESFINIAPKRYEIGDIIVISSLLYDTHKKTSYQIPSDITLTISDVNNEWEVQQYWLPKDWNFIVSDGINNIQWYAYYPRPNEQCFYENILWDDKKFSAVFPQMIDEEKWIVKLDINTKKNICLIAGVSNIIIPVLDRQLPEKNISFELAQWLDDEENLQNQIIITSSSPFLQNNEDVTIYNQKIQEIVKNISISPAVEIAEKNIKIEENKIIVTTYFENNTEYTIRLHDVMDIYGREISDKFTFTPQHSQFLSLHTIKNQRSFHNISDIRAKIFAISPEKRNFEVKICKLDVYAYGKISDIADEKDKNKLAEVYDLVNSSHASKCQKAEVSLNEKNISEFALQDIFDTNDISSGFYVLMFRDFDDIKNIENFAWIVPFSLVNTNFVSHFLSTGNVQFSVFSDKNEILPNQEIEIFVKQSWENGNIYGTGEIIGYTNEKWFLSANIEKFSDSDAIIIARWWWNFGYFSPKIPELNKNLEFTADIFAPNNIYEPSENIPFSAVLYKNYDILAQEKVHIFLLTPDGQKIQNSTVISNEFGLVSWYFSFHNNLKKWKYHIAITSEANENIIFAKKEIIIEWIQKKSLQSSVSFKFLNTENFVPKNLKQKAYENEEKPYYKFLYSADVQAEILAQVKNENNEFIKNSPFDYKIYRIDNAQKTLILEWKSSFDANGMGMILENVAFESFGMPVKYEAEILVQNPKDFSLHSFSSETYIKIPEEYKTFDDSFIPDFYLNNEVLSSGDMIEISFWEKTFEHILNGKYIVNIQDSVGNILHTSDILESKMQIQGLQLPIGQYFAVVSPASDVALPENIIAKKSFFIADNTQQFHIPEIFMNMKSREIFIPFSSDEQGKKILITIFYKNKIFSDFVSVWKNGFQYIIPQEIDISDIQISALIFGENNETHLLQKSYKNEEDKNFSLQIGDFKNEENFEYPEISWLLENENNNTILHIFEWKNNDSIFNLHQNSKYTQWSIFINNENFSKLSLSNNAEIKNNFSGKSLFLSSFQKNDIFPDVKSLKNPYYIELFTYTQDGKMGYKKEKFQQKPDFELSSNIPKNIFVGDKVIFEISAKNLTNTITQAEVYVDFSYNDEVLNVSEKIILNLNQPKTVFFPVKFPDNWRGKIDYIISLKKDENMLSEEKGSIMIEEIPVMGLHRTTFWGFSGSTDIKLFNDSLYNSEKSEVEIFISSDLWVLIPNALESIKNSPKNNHKDILYDFIARAKILKNPKFSHLVDENILKTEIADFLQKNPYIFSESQNSYAHLEMIHLLAMLYYEQKTMNEVFVFEMKKYFSTHFVEKFHEFSDYERVKIISIMALLWENIDNFTQNIAFEKLEKNNLTELIFSHFIAKKSIPDPLIAEYFAKNVSEDNESSFISSYQERLKIVKIFLILNKKDEFKQSIEKFFSSTTNIYSIEENFYTIDLALLHTEKNSAQSSKITMNSGIISAESDVNTEKNFIFWSFIKSKLSDNISVKSSSEYDFFYLIKEKNTLDAPSLFPQKNSDFLEISQKIEKIYEEWGYNENGEYKISEIISDNFLQKNGLYKVNIQVKIKNMDNKKWQHIFVKMFTLPGAEIFYQDEVKNNSIFEQKFPFYRIQKSQYFLLGEKAGSVGNTEFEYSYYMRPKNSGSYLLPWSFVYFSDGKEFFANSSHQYFHIQ